MLSPYGITTFFRREYSQEGTDLKPFHDQIPGLIHYITDTYSFSLTWQLITLRSLMIKHITPKYAINFETRPSTICSDALQNVMQTWTAHRVTFTSSLHSRYPLERLGLIFLNRDAVAAFLSTFTSLRIFEFDCKDGYGGRMELLNVVHEALQGFPSWRLKDEAILECGEFSKLRIVREG